MGKIRIFAVLSEKMKKSLLDDFIAFASLWNAVYIVVLEVGKRFRFYAVKMKFRYLGLILGFASDTPPPILLSETHFIVK